MAKTIILATNNRHKVLELKALLRDYNLLTLTELGFKNTLSETGKTLEANSSQKATRVWEIYKKPCLADDSGLEVQALNNAPGVYSARYAGYPTDDQRNMDLLLRNLKNHNNRQATFKTVLTYIDQSKVAHQFKGEVKGWISEQKEGDKGFGYDPIFIPLGYDKTFAQMTAAHKDAISHRAKALKKFQAFLNLKVPEEVNLNTAL